MKIAIAGMGYVGLSQAVLLAHITPYAWWMWRRRR